jgi:hypothetical protein
LWCNAWSPSALRQEHNDVAGFIYAVVGVAYAVLLAFVVVVVWEEYERAKDTVETEANELAGVYFLADRFSDEADRAVSSSPSGLSSTPSPGKPRSRLTPSRRCCAASRKIEPPRPACPPTRARG